MIMRVLNLYILLWKEEIQHRKYYNFEEARRAIFKYIESWYNRKRIHGSIDYMTLQTYKNAAKSIA